jgi:hypothetical protein
MFKNTGSGLKIPTLFSGYHHQQEAEPRFVGHVANITVTVGREAVLSCSVTDLQDYKERPPRIIIIKTRCCYKTVNFVTAASQKGVCITQGKSHKII